MNRTTITLEAEHFKMLEDGNAGLPDTQMQPLAQVKRDDTIYTLFHTTSAQLVIQSAHLHSALLAANGQPSATVTDILMLDLGELIDAAGEAFAGASDEDDEEPERVGAVPESCSPKE